MRNFRELDIWNEGIALAVIAYHIVKQFPNDELYGLKSQVKRASISIASNIAEGCSRKSQKEFRYFLTISLGSAFEIETDLILAEKLGMISHQQLNEFLLRLHTLQKRINSLIGKLGAGS